MAIDTESNIYLNIIPTGASALKGVTASVASLTATVKQLDIALAQAKAHGGLTGISLAPMGKATTEARQYAAAMHQVGLSVKEPAKQFKDLYQNQQRLTAGIKRTGMVGLATADNLRTMGTTGLAGMTQISRGMETASLRTRMFRTDLRALSLRMQGAMKNFQWLGRQMMVGLSIPLAAFGALAISSFRKVEEEQVRLKKVFFEVGTSVEDQARIFDTQLAPAIDRISQNMGQSRVITTALMADWAQFGTRSKNELRELTEITSRFALLGDIDIDVATPYVRSIFATFGEGDLQKTVHLLEEMNAIENATALSTADLAESLPEIASVAQNLNMPLSQVAAQLASMVNVGIPVNEAVHALKFGLQRLVNPTQDAIDVMDSLHFSFFNADGSSKDVSSALIELSGKMANLTDQGKNFAISEIFGNRQASRMGSLINDLENMGDSTEISAEAASAFNTAMQAAAGNVAAVADEEERAVKASTGFKLRKLKEEFKMFMEDFGAELADPLIIIMEAIMKVVKGFSNLSKKFKTIIVGAAVLVAALGPVIFVFAQLGLVFSTVIHLATFFGRATRLISADQAEAILSSGTFKGSITRVGDAFVLTSGKMGHYIEQLGIENTVTIRSIELTQAHATALRDLEAARIGQTNSYVMPEGGSGTPGMRTNRAGAAGALGVDLADDINFGNIGAGASATDDAVDAIDDVGDSSRRSRGLLAGLGSAFAGIVGFIRHPITGLKSFGTALANIFTHGSKIGRLASAFSKFGTVFKGIAGKAGVIGAVITVIVLAFNGLKKHWKAFSQEASKAWKPIKDALDGLWSAIKKVGDSLSPIIDGFKKFEGAASEGKNAKAFWKGLGQAIHFVGEIIGAVIDAVAWLVRMLSGPIGEVAQTIGGLLGRIADFVGDVVGLLGALFAGDWTEVWRMAQNVVIDMVNGVISWIEFMVDSILLGARYIVEGLADMVGGIGNLLNLLPGVEDSTGGIEDMINGIASAIDELRAGSFQIDEIEAPSVADDAETHGHWRNNGEKYAEEFERGAGEPEVNPEIDPGGEEAADEWLSEWLGAVQGALQDQIAELRQQAMDALNAKFEQDLSVYDDRIEAIEAVEKAEERRFAREEYLQRRREQLRSRSIQFENYTRDRALAIYEGRIDDARMIDLEEKRNKYDHLKTMADLEESRRRELIKQARDDEKEKIQIAKDAAKERQDLLRESFEKQLEIITQYAPRTVAEFQTMLNRISGALWQAGVKDWPGAARTGMGLYALAIRNANETLRQQAAWSGDNAATAWLAAFVAGDVKAGLQAANATNAPDIPELRGGGGGRPGRPNRTSGLNQTTAPGAPSPGGYHHPRYHTGGKVPGISKRDVPATLQTGEFVMQRDAVRAVGASTLEQLNQAHVVAPKFHAGGLVGSGADPAAQIGSGMHEFVHTLTNAWMYNQTAIGGLTSSLVAYFFENMGATVGGKTLADIMPSGSYSNIDEFANWIISLPQFSGLSFGGTPGTGGQARPQNPSSDHPRGFAADFSRGRGSVFDPMLETLAQFLLAGGEAGTLPTKYVIYFDRFGASYTGWDLDPPVRSYDRHLDHVHLSVLDSIAQFGARAAAAGSGGGSGPGGTSGYDGPAGDLRAMAREALAQKGFTPNQFGALDNLITHESSWNPNALGPMTQYGRAYGLYQFLDQTWAGTGYQKSSNPWIQHLAGLTYIRGRYGNPGAAWDYWQGHHSYHDGGLVPMLAGGKVPFDNYPARLHKGEIVMPEPISKNLTKMADNDAIMGTTVNINADTFVGDFDYFCKQMARYDVQVKPKKALAAGTSVRRVSSRGAA